MTTRIVNLHKVKGKRPSYDIYIGRKVRNTEFTESSKWHNPFYVKKWGEKTLELYEDHICACIRSNPFQYNIEELRGKVLGCWCKPGPCHGDILLKLLQEKREFDLHSLVGTTDEMSVERK